jgi:hypothetical protein
MTMRLQKKEMKKTEEKKVEETNMKPMKCLLADAARLVR